MSQVHYTKSMQISKYKNVSYYFVQYETNLEILLENSKLIFLFLFFYDILDHKLANISILKK